MNLLSKKKTVKKPWGFERWFAQTKDYMGKILVIYPGEQVSIHYHEKKEETMYVFKGVVRVTHNGLVRVLYAGDVIHVLPGDIHTMKCVSEERAAIFEVSTPHPDDSIRVKDFYDRTRKKDS